MAERIFEDLLVIDCASFVAGPAAGTPPAASVPTWTQADVTDRRVERRAIEAV